MVRAYIHMAAATRQPFSFIDHHGAPPKQPNQSVRVLGLSPPVTATYYTQNNHVLCATAASDGPRPLPPVAAPDDDDGGGGRSSIWFVCVGSVCKLYEVMKGSVAASKD